ncbi:hypothetical protein HBI44_224490 [Parastagonospora nodorum]|nr:hypothetical protein HBI44_224490 [Parastagonospora nodorum]
MTDSPRARTLINLSAVLYEQSAARLSLPAEVGNIDLDFVPSVAFISNVYIADSLRARTLINLSAVSNINLNFVLSVAFISNVYMADSLRARTPINLSAVLYEQAAARTGLSAEVSNISPRARTLINPSAVLYEQADAQSSLSAEVGIIDLDFVPGITFDAIGNVDLTALLNPRLLASKRSASSGSDLNCGRTDPTIATLLAKRIKTDEDRKKSTHCDDDNVQLVRDNIEELICVGKVKHTYVLFRRAGNNRNNLNIIVTDPTSREFSRVDMKSLTRLSGEGPLGSPFLGLISMTLYKFYKGKNIQLLQPVFELQRYDYYNLQDSDSLTRIQAIDPSFQTDQFTYIYVLRSVDKIRADVADVFNTVISKLDKVPTRELSSHIKTELLRDNGRKFYRLIITGEDTHCKQTIKKAYIMLLERASLILFIT